MNYFINIWIKFFFLLTPFFTLSMYLSMTKNLNESKRQRLSYRVTVAILLTCFFLYFFGNYIFLIFGITLDSFRIGAGILLFLSAVRMVQDDSGTSLGENNEEEIAVVPLAIPITVGPATIGALLVMGAEVRDSFHKFVGFLALIAAVLCVGLLLLLSTYIERVIGKKGFTILGKLTGLVLAALAAQITFTGIKNFLTI